MIVGVDLMNKSSLDDTYMESDDGYDKDGEEETLSDFEANLMKDHPDVVLELAHLDKQDFPSNKQRKRQRNERIARMEAENDQNPLSKEKRMAKLRKIGEENAKLRLRDATNYKQHRKYLQDFMDEREKAEEKKRLKVIEEKEGMRSPLRNEQQQQRDICQSDLWQKMVVARRKREEESEEKQLKQREMEAIQETTIATSSSTNLIEEEDGYIHSSFEWDGGNISDEEEKGSSHSSNQSENLSIEPSIMANDQSKELEDGEISEEFVSESDNDIVFDKSPRKRRRNKEETMRDVKRSRMDENSRDHRPKDHSIYRISFHRDRAQREKGPLSNKTPTIHSSFDRKRSEDLKRKSPSRGTPGRRIDSRIRETQDTRQDRTMRRSSERVREGKRRSLSIHLRNHRLGIRTQDTRSSDRRERNREEPRQERPPRPHRPLQSNNNHKERTRASPKRKREEKYRPSNRDSPSRRDTKR